MHESRALPVAAECIEVRAMGSEALVHDVLRKKVHVLNASAARIFALCDGTRDAEKIAGLMSSQTGEPQERMLRDVARALETFARLELISYV